MGFISTRRRRSLALPDRLARESWLNRGNNSLSLRANSGRAPGGGPPAINPPNLATLQFWYDFTDRSTLYTDTARTTQVTAAGQTINGITDKGVAAHHADSTGEVGPVYTKSGQNGLSYALFDGGTTTQFLAPASPTFDMASGEDRAFLAIVETTDANAGIAFSTTGAENQEMILRHADAETDFPSTLQSCPDGCGRGR